MRLINRYAWAFASVALVGCSTASSSLQNNLPSPQQNIFEGMLTQRRWLMGTDLTISILPPAEKDGAAILRQGFERVRYWEELLSNYREKSELSRLNRAAGAGPITVHSDLYQFLEQAKQFSNVTQGAFALTAGTLATNPSIAISDDHGFELLPDNRVRLIDSQTQIDPGAIGKGYAVDRLIRFLREQGVKRAFVNFGGSTFYGIGAPPNRPGWPVLLRGAKPESSLGIVHLAEQSLSTSHSFISDVSTQTTRHHIVDPRNGVHVAESRFAAAISSSAAAAEVWSTALIVAPELLEQPAKQPPAVVRLVQHSNSPPQRDAGFKISET